MRRRTLLAASLAAALLPRFAAAQELSLSDLSAYLNGLTQAEATFTQVNADGSTSTGTVYIHRPWRMRFEYDPPSKALVIASSGSVAIFDPKSNQPPEQYPLGRTPLNLILAPVIDLNTAKMVVDHYATDDRTVVIAQDPAHSEYGTIALYFSAAPIALRQWVVTDQSGAKTTVTLSDLKPVAALKDSLFDIRSQVGRRTGN